jgi:hypothetical protein
MIPVPKDNEVIPEALSKALVPIEVTLFGIVTDVTPDAHSNALFPIEVTPDGILTAPSQS